MTLFSILDSNSFLFLSIMDIFSWFQSSTSTSKTLVIDIPTIRSIPFIDRFSTTFLTTLMSNSTEKNNFYDHLDIPKNNSSMTSSSTMTTTTTKLITSGMNHDILRHTNYTNIFQTFINAFIEKKQQDFYMILIFFAIFVCVTIIIIIILIIIMKYQQTSRSFKG